MYQLSTLNTATCFAPHVIECSQDVLVSSPAEFNTVRVVRGWVRCPSHGLAQSNPRPALSIDEIPLFVLGNFCSGALLSASGDYVMPPDGNRKAYLEYIEVNPSPLLGLVRPLT